MAYTVQQLITRSFYLADIVGQEFSTVSGPQIKDGLQSLNDLLAEKTVDLGLNPYYKGYEFAGVIGQEEYVVENLSEVTTLTFTLDTVRYSITPVQRDQYFGSARPNDVNSLPVMWHFEKELDGGRIFIYFPPSQAMTFNLRGKFSLEEVGQFDDLSLVYDRFYLSYLKYKLAERLCDDFGFNVPASVMKRITAFNGMFKDQMSPMDVKMKKISTLSGGGALNYGQINIGRAWTPGYGG